MALPDGQHVRLRSRHLDAYLHASTDGEGVCIHRNPASMNAAWVVHGIPVDHIHVRVLLHSAAYGRYLAATDSPALRGQHGFRIVQVMYYEYQADSSIMWELITHDNYVQFCNSGGRGTRHLRANGRYFRFNAGRTRYLPRNTGVTIEDLGPTTHWDWVVETIPPCQAYPGIPGPINEPVPGNVAPFFGRQRRPTWRLIRFVQAAEDGSYNQQAFQWNAFDFTGNSIFRLRRELAEMLQAVDTNIIMCVRPGRLGRLTPMLVDMPRDGDGHTVFIVVFIAGTPGEAALHYPDING